MRRKLKRLSPRRVQYIHAVLHTALEQALKWRLIERNPGDAVEGPRAEKREPVILLPDPVKRLLETIHGDRLRAMYVLALTATMRQAELLGLLWSQVDFPSGMLHVTNAFERLHGKWRLKDPKTRGSKRGIRLSRWAVDALRERWDIREAERQAAGESWRRTDLVFTHPDGRPLDSKTVTARNFYPILKRAGLPPMHSHGLRHSAANLYMAMGVPPEGSAGNARPHDGRDDPGHLQPPPAEPPGEAVAKMDALLESLNPAAQ